MQKNIFITFFICFFCYIIQAQETVPPMYSGKVEIIKDGQIDEIIGRRTEVNKKTEGKASGYRVQIHFGSDRNKAKEIKSDFLTKYPDIITYEIYQQPNFKIRVGDFKNKLDAYRLLKQISNNFTGSFIVEDKVEMMKID